MIFKKLGLVIMSTSKYEDMINRLIAGWYANGYEAGYNQGKAEGLISSVTPNEIRKIFGLEPMKGDL